MTNFGDKTIMVWTDLEVPPERAAHAQEARAKQVIRVLHAGAAEIAWSTRYEVDYGLRWDADREVWVAADGFTFDGSALCYTNSTSPLS
jgi:hypothetical protein